MKRKGVIFIEAVFVIPLIFLSILLVLDISLNAYLKSSVKSVVTNTLNSVEYELKSKNDLDLTVIKNYDITPENLIQAKLKRTILDEFHNNLDVELIKKRIVSQIKEKTLLKAEDIEVDVIKQNGFPFHAKVIVKTNLKINTLLTGVYQKLNVGFERLETQDVIELNDYFSSITLIDAVGRALENNQDIAELIDSVWRLSEQVARLIGG